MTIALIGGGVAGLACAGALAAAGRATIVFDKGRGPGGRLSTRRVATPSGEAAFDHGAQYFTARAPAFVAAVADWTARGAVREWQGRLVAIDMDGDLAPLDPEPRHVGVPGMNALVKALAAGLDVRWGVRVGGFKREGAGWRLRDEAGGDLGLAETICVATPGEQVPPLLADHAPALAAAAAGSHSAPCWAGLFAFETLADPGFDAARIRGDGPLAWVALEQGKPGRAGPPRLVVHATPEWSAAHLEADPEWVAGRLFAATRAIIDAPPPVFAQAHRWRHAQVKSAATGVAPFDPALGLGVCGDWLKGPRVELAWASGRELAAAILSA
jgi:predicted NAD/FAD-dependent oxidoreductase